jgi:tellurite resistance protein TerC
MPSTNVVPGWLWATFAVLLGATLAVDLLAHRGGRETSRRAAIVWSFVWVGVGLGFAGLVAWQLGRDAAEQYLAAYLIEKSLSVDNLFVFLLIFGSLNVPAEAQHKVLSYGIFGALVMRALFVLLGTAAIERWHGVVYVFAGLLLFAAWRALRDDPSQHTDSKVVRWLARRLPVAPELDGERFFTRRDGRLVATPLLVAVAAVELTDVAFAIDSVPAALSVTRDRFLVYSSNAFAILGLRALYLVLAQTLAELVYLHYGLAFVLAFAALKMIAAPWVHVPAWLSVLIIAVAIAAAVVASLRHTRGRRRTPPRRAPPPAALPRPLR